MKMTFVSDSLRALCMDPGLAARGGAWLDAAICLALLYEVASLADLSLLRQLSVTPVKAGRGGVLFSVVQNAGEVHLRAVDEGGSAVIIGDGIEGLRAVTRVLVLTVVCGGSKLRGSVAG
jgi:hypothetical protein